MCWIAKWVATKLLIELCDEKKAPSNFLSSVLGKYSQAVITENEKMACMGKMAHNFILESNHASSTSALITGGMIRLDHAMGEGQTRANNDFGRGHETLIGRGGETNKDVGLGTYFKLSPKL